MTLENECASLELCKKWKEIGGRQDTALFIFDNGDVVSAEFYENQTPAIKSHYVAAPMIGELMEWLRYDIDCIWPTEDFWNWRSNTEQSDYDKSLPNALIQMAIWEKEKK